jgi:hypothetical protein
MSGSPRPRWFSDDLEAFEALEPTFTRLVTTWIDQGELVLDPGDPLFAFYVHGDKMLWDVRERRLPAHAEQVFGLDSFRVDMRQALHHAMHHLVMRATRHEFWGHRDTLLYSESLASSLDVYFEAAFYARTRDVARLPYGPRIGDKVDASWGPGAYVALLEAAAADPFAAYRRMVPKVFEGTRRLLELNVHQVEREQEQRPRDPARLTELLAWLESDPEHRWFCAWDFPNFVLFARNRAGDRPVERDPQLVEGLRARLAAASSMSTLVEGLLAEAARA